MKRTYLICLLALSLALFQNCVKDEVINDATEPTGTVDEEKEDPDQEEEETDSDQEEGTDSDQEEGTDSVQEEGTDSDQEDGTFPDQEEETDTDPFMDNGDNNNTNTTGELTSRAEVRARLNLASNANFSQNWESRKVTGTSPIEKLITKADFDLLFPKNIRSQGHDKNLEYYTYSNLVEASKYFPKFLNEGSDTDKYRELAAFFGNKSHETGDGWPALGTERWNYGLFWIVELAALSGNINPQNQNDLYKAHLDHYVDFSNSNYPPVAGKSYHGRGPVQLSWNYNYGAMSEQMFQDKNVLLSSPDLIAREGIYGWASAIWFWMEPQGNKPSAHDVMVGNVDLSEPYTAATSRQNRSVRSHTSNSRGHNAAGNPVSYTGIMVPAGAEVGFGMTINIINGGLESNTGSIDNRQARRIGYFARYLDIFGKNKLGLSEALSPQVSGGGDPVTQSTVQLMRTWRDWHYLPQDGRSPGGNKDFPKDAMPNIMSNIWTSSF